MTEGPSPYAGTAPVASLSRTEGTVTLVQGQTFCLSERTGDMQSDLPHGLFVFDTRVLSRWQLRLNGHLVEPLAVEVTEPFSASFVGHGAPAPGHADADLVVYRHRHIGRGLRERIVIENHGLRSAEVLVEIACDVDFADLFEVKEGRTEVHRRRARTADHSAMCFSHNEDGGLDEVEIRATTPATVDAGLCSWRATLEPKGRWQTCVELSVSLRDERVEPRFTCTGGDDVEAVPARRLEQWRARLPVLRTDDRVLASTYARSAEDLGALRIFDPDHPDLAIVAAGAPWFMTVFGRDSLLTAWMTLIADSSLAHGVLETLARFQGARVDERTEEEPGKILHEMRFGSTTGLALGGGDVYYGSIDATPLFVMLLGELRRWEPDDALVTELLPHADRALGWITEYGDRDGDGYVEYRRRNAQGLANQGWKDSWDAIRFRDGRLAPTPLALCEVQGYVYAAYLARAQLARGSGDTKCERRWSDAAEDLRTRFNEDFWSEEHGWYVLGLDGDRQQVDALASNIGHCLWTGIIDPDRAASVAARLVGSEMFSGFGTRTLATSMAAYNPVSYHNGSIWPHDNAICAAGLARYGFVEEAQRIISAQLDVAAHLGGRLPELFAGFDRADLGVPVDYPTSCSPQAWASASPLMWLRTLLRLDPSAPDDLVRIDPAVPPRIGLLEVSDIRVGRHRLSVRVEGDEVEVDTTPGLVVERSAQEPFSPGRR
jgi:glycogen debranching enzyme